MRTKILLAVITMGLFGGVLEVAADTEEAIALQVDAFVTSGDIVNAEYADSMKDLIGLAQMERDAGDAISQSNFREAFRVTADEACGLLLITNDACFTLQSMAQ